MKPGRLYEHLRRHGILIENEALVGKGETVGKILQDAIRNEDFGLLVTGAYSLPDWYELIFGGTTRSVLLSSSIPLLIAH